MLTVAKTHVFWQVKSRFARYRSRIQGARAGDAFDFRTRLPESNCITRRWQRRDAWHGAS
jgi:hypothetical protein